AGARGAGPGAGPATGAAAPRGGGEARRPRRRERRVPPPGQPLAKLLEGVQGAVVVDEADHVPRDAPLPDLDQPLVPPVRQRLRPRQGEQPGRVIGGGRGDEPHKTIFSPNRELRAPARPLPPRRAPSDPKSTPPDSTPS